MLALFSSLFIFTSTALATATTSHPGAETGLSLPRFASLKFQEVNVRCGPERHYQIKYTYRHQHYPVEIIAEFEHWRLVKDHENSEGWVHKSLLSGGRYVIIKDNKLEQKVNYTVPKGQSVLLRLPDEASHPVLKAELGAVARVNKCSRDWCQVRMEKISGWINKKNLWGVYQDEIFSQ